MAKYGDWYDEFRRKVDTSVWDMIEYGMTRDVTKTQVFEVGKTSPAAELDPILGPEMLMLSTLEAFRSVILQVKRERIGKQIAEKKLRLGKNENALSALYNKSVETAVVLPKQRDPGAAGYDDLIPFAPEAPDDGDFMNIPEGIDDEIPFERPVQKTVTIARPISLNGTPEERERAREAVIASKNLTSPEKQRFNRIYAENQALENELNSLNEECEKISDLLSRWAKEGVGVDPDYKRKYDYLEIEDSLAERMIAAIKAAVKTDPDPKPDKVLEAMEDDSLAAGIFLMRYRYLERAAYLNREAFVDELKTLFRRGTPNRTGKIKLQDVAVFCCDYLEEETRWAALAPSNWSTSITKGTMQERAEIFRQLYCRITEKVFAQDAAVSKFLRGLFEGSLVALKDRSGPEASFLFMGPPGVGKTYLADVSSKLLNRPCKVFYMSEYAHESSFNGLVGFERTWKSAQPGDLTEYVMENPNAILIFDEVEKAHQRTVRLFLSMLEGGKVRDIYHEKDVDFRKTIVIFTTNAGRQFYEERTDLRISNLPVQMLVDALKKDKDPVSEKQVMPNELISRLEKGNIIGFDHMTPIKLLPIIREGIDEGVKEAEISMGIRCEYDREKLPHLLMFRMGTTLDARVASAKSKDFIKEMLYSLMERMAEDKRKHGNCNRIRIAADRNAVTKELLHLPKGENGKCFLVFTYANNKKYSECFDNVIAGKQQRYSVILYRGKGNIEREGGNDIRDILRHNEVDAILVDPLWWKSAGGNKLEEKNGEMEGLIQRRTHGNEVLRWLLEQDDVPPVYAVAFDKNFDLKDRLELQERGVREILQLKLSDPDFSKARLDELAYELFLNEKLEQLMSRGRALDFKVRYQVGGKKGKGEEAEPASEITIQLYDFKKITSMTTDAENVVVPDTERKGRGFKDVIGAKDAIKALEHFIYYIRDPKGYRRSGQRVSKGILLYGPPGTGKTMLARALSQEADCPFIAVSAAQFVNGSRKVSEVFALARKYGPSILFIDEIDAVAMSRGFSQGTSNPILNEMLTQMDGFEKDLKHPVFVIAATNAAEKPGLHGHRIYIDPALQRRFTKKIYVDLPDKDERIAYLNMRIDALRDGEYNFNALKESEIEQFAIQTAGYSIGDIENVIDTTISVAVDERMQSITLDLMIRCFEEAMYGEKLKVDQRFIRSVAIHEIGHAYLSFLGGERFTPQYATIVARANYLGMVSHIPEEIARGLTKSDILKHIRICLAGRAAEQVCLGEEEGLDAGADNDLMKATHFAALLIGLYGMEEGFLPVFTFRGDVYPMDQMMNSPMAEKYYAKISEILTRELNTTKDLIRKNQKNVEATADKLLEKTRLNTKELRKYLKIKGSAGKG